MVVPDFDLGGKRGIHSLKRNPIQGVDDKGLAIDLFLFANNHSISLSIDADHVKGLVAGQAKSSPLSNRIKGNPLMLTQDVSFGVDDRSGFDDIPPSFLQKRMIGILLNEADLLA